LGFWGLNYLLPGRLDGLLDFKSGSLAARANFYQAAADAIVKKPVFGYGLENSGEVFIRYYQADWGIYGDVGSTTDKAHNLVLDIVLATGFLGLFLYTILYYYFFRLAQENIKKNKKKSLSLALSFGVLAYLFSLMFSFSIVAGEVYFWLFLALLVVIGTGNNCEEYQTIEFKAKRKINIFTKLIIILAVGLPIGWGVYYEFRVLIADHYFNCLYYTLAEEKYFTTFVLADYISNQKTSPINQKYYDRFLGDKLSDFYPNITELSSKKGSQDKLQEIEKRLSSRGYENLFIKAKINSALGNYQMAEKYFREVIKISPDWPKTYIELARLFVKQGNFKEAILNYRLAEVILPAANDSRLNDLHRQVLNLYQKIIAVELGDIYFNLKDYPAAEKYYQQAYRLDVRDFSLFKRIADTFYLRGDLKTALAYNLRGTTRNPRDYNWFFGVAVLYQEIGDKEKALFFLDKALELAPTEETLIKLRLKYQS
jgi:tetratricopeptide (TPR) repeat protein